MPEAKSALSPSSTSFVMKLSIAGGKSKPYQNLCDGEE